MITGRFEPASLSRAQLDELLARGWYRIGHVMITTDYLVSDGHLRSAVWTRLDLERHRFRTSLRKRMARSARRFQTRVGPAVIDPAHEELYARYREMMGGNRADTLDEVLGGEAGRLLFETREIGVFSGDRLVAFSWFDLGETSVQSLIGVYDPEHRRHGLGFYTLLLEIEHAAELGMRFHYSGYVLSGCPSMDYKADVGQLDYLDPATRRWLREPPFDVQGSPAAIQRHRLGEAAEVLVRSGSSVLCVLNAALQISAIREQLPRCAAEPILLMCTSPNQEWGLLVTWEQEHGRYAIFNGVPVSLVIERGDEGDAEAEPEPIHCFIVHERLGDCTSADEVAFRVRYHLP